MAESNSKKPMALLLLVVVAVLVVIMVSGGNDFTDHASLTTTEDCTTEGGAWTATIKDVADWDKTEAGCGDNTFTAAVVAVADDTTTPDVDETVAAADATCTEVDADADPAGTCSDDWANDTTKEDCEAAHGAWTDAVADDAATADVDETVAASCGAPAAE